MPSCNQTGLLFSGKATGLMLAGAQQEGGLLRLAAQNL